MEGKIVSLAASLFLGLFAASQDAGCAPCHGLGRVDCPQHSAAELALERNALRCSFRRACATCGGRLSLDCGACTRGELAAETERKLAERLERDAARYSEALGRPAPFAASANFNLVSTLPPTKADRRRVNAHELVHVYLDRLEAMHAAYLELFTLPPDMLAVRSEVFLWSESADHGKVGKAVCSYESEDPIFRRGPDIAAVSLWLDPQKLADDDALHRQLVHHVAHGLMNAEPPPAWTGQLRVGWLDEGFPLWFEERLLGSTTGFCYWPVEQAKALRAGQFRAAVRKHLESGEAFDFERFLELDPPAMTRLQQAFGFALVEHLATHGVEPLHRFLARVRAKTNLRDALKEVYGQDVAALRASFSEWVARTYPRR